MSYAKKIGTASLYQGTSFTLSVGKEEKTVDGVVTQPIWEVNEIGDFEVTDDTNTVVLSGALVKSVDDLSLTAVIGQTDCADWEGNYRIISYQTDSNDARIKVPIADYDLDYSTTKAE